MEATTGLSYARLTRFLFWSRTWSLYRMNLAGRGMCRGGWCLDRHCIIEREMDAMRSAREVHVASFP